MDETITFVGSDVHKNSIAVEVTDGGVAGEFHSLGMIDNTTKALDRLIAGLVRSGQTVGFCYEAGLYDYGVCRHLQGRRFPG